MAVRLRTGQLLNLSEFETPFILVEGSFLRSIVVTSEA
jgi:hypothetical protein